MDLCCCMHAVCPLGKTPLDHHQYEPLMDLSLLDHGDHQISGFLSSKAVLHYGLLHEMCVTSPSLHLETSTMGM